MKEQTFVIENEKGPSLNAWYAGSHWSKRNKIKNRWRQIMKREVQENNLEPVEEYPVTVSVTIIFGKGSRSYDASNCAATAKLIEDGLVKEGILEDDSNKYVRSVHLTSIKRSDGEDHIIVQITEGIHE